MSKVLIGADPEVALYNEAGALVPAWNVTKGTKKGEKEILDPAYELSIHADGVALELNMLAVDPSIWVAHIDVCTMVVSSWLTERNYVHSAKPVIGGWTREALMHPLATEIGCSEDFYAYSENPDIARPIINMPDLGSERCFGGHIHFGYDKSIIPPFALVRLLDAFLYLPLILADKQGLRRRFYGLPGLFREKPYGVEYRTPSNFWLYARSVKNIIAHNTAEIFRALEDSADGVHQAYRAMDWDNLIQVMTNADTERMQVHQWWENIGLRVSSKLGMNLRTMM